MVRIVQQPPQQVTTELPEMWCVYQWRMPCGYSWAWRPWTKESRQPFNANNQPTDTIVHVIDPLTAIGLGLVTPEELHFPPGILAAFNLLSKEQT